MKGLIFAVAVGSSAIFGMAGCGSDTHRTKPAVAAKLNPIELAQADISALTRFDSRGGQAIDLKYRGMFSAVFGGTQGAQLLRFLSERVRHLVDPEKSAFVPADFANKKWLSKPSRPAALKYGSQKYQVGAANIGTLMWLQGLINRVPVILSKGDGSVIPIDSSRSGVVILGAAYKAVDKDSSGTEFTLPPEYRQAILLHEARHSDCTGGIAESQLTLLRGLADSDEYEKTFKSMPCGHLHRVCRSGDLIGVAACDSEPWGAYAVGALYSLAAFANAKSRLDKEIMKHVYLDQIQRVQGDPDAVLSGRLGRPDMTSQGLVRDVAPSPVPVSRELPRS